MEEMFAEDWYHQEDERIQESLHEDRYHESFADGSGARSSVALGIAPTQ